MCLQGQAIEGVEGLDGDETGADDRAGVDLLGHTVNRHADLGLVVEQLPQADRPAAAVVRNLALVDIDRPEARNLEEPRLQNRRPVHDRQIRPQAMDEFQGVLGMHVRRHVNRSTRSTAVLDQFMQAKPLSILGREIRVEELESGRASSRLVSPHRPTG